MAELGGVADKYLGKIFAFGGKILNAIKLLCITIGLIIFMGLCYLAFGYLFFVGFFICAPLSLLFFNKFLEVPSRHIWECQIADEKGEKRERIGLLKMPMKRLGKIETEGGNLTTINSVSGKQVTIVERYDEKNNKFITHWIPKVSSYEFFSREEGYFELQTWVRDKIRAVVRLLANWKVYQSLELKQVYEHTDYTTDLKELEKKFSAEDKYVLEPNKEGEKDTRK